MDTLQWQSFEKKIYIHASLEKLYWCWATEEGLTSWFLRDAEFKRSNTKIEYGSYVDKGDTYTWYWHNWDGKAEGEILEANGKDFIAFSFEGSNVSVSLKEHHNKVIVTLKQYDIPEDEENKLKIHCGCSNGWTFWLTNLKAYLEHGILLNEREETLKDNHLAGWVFVNM